LRSFPKCFQNQVNVVIFKKFFLYLSVIFIFISCASTPLPPPVPVTIPQDFFGMVHAGNTETPEEYALLDEMGVEWILYTFYWHRMEREKGIFDFSHYDSYVDKGREAGKKIVAVLAYDAPWLYPDGERRRYIAPENIPLFLNFVEKTVDHFRGRVDAWEIWNEPNFMFWKGSDKEFFELAKLTALKIRETDLQANILGGAFWRVPKGFIRAMFKAGALENVDGLAFHPYALNPRGAVKLYDKFTSVLSEFNYSGPLWITEAGYPTGGWYPTSVSEDEQPAYVVKTITGIAAKGARALLWYQLFDSYNRGQSLEPRNSEAYFGLVYPDYSRKKGAYAYTLCARYLAGKDYRPDLIEKNGIPKSLIVFYFAGRDGNNTLVLWNDKSSTVKIHISLGNPGLLHDVSTGENAAIPGETALDIGAMPVIITWKDKEPYGVPLISYVKRD
jgi:hypothetical protein